MARYIDDILQPDEKLLYSTNVHWIFYLPAIVAWLVAGVLLVVARMFIQDFVVLFCLAAAAIVALAALYLTFRAWFRRWTTETDVTNRRVVHKEGFIKRDTFEMSLDKVESVDVSQSIMIEQITGALFIAILIARLAGVYPPKEKYIDDGAA